MSPAHGIHPMWCWCSRAVPRVAVISSERNPIRPRLGHSNVTIVRPASPVRRSVMRPLRGASSWVTVPTCSSGTSHTPRSCGSKLLAVDFLGDDLGPADLQLVALAAHRLDQHRQLQLAAAGDLDDVGRAGLEQLDRHVAEQLLVRAGRRGGGW